MVVGFHKAMSKVAIQFCRLLCSVRGHNFRRFGVLYHDDPFHPRVIHRIDPPGDCSRCGLENATLVDGALEIANQREQAAS